MTVVDETRADETPAESRVFEADVAKLLHLMVHSVYSDKSVFLRELISNAADAYEKLRYEAIAEPALLGEDPKPRITLAIDPEQRTLTVEDNGIGMSRDEMVEALGTIARSGTRAFLERIEAAKGNEQASLIGQFGIGFYSAFMVADRIDVFSRRAGTLITDEAEILPRYLRFVRGVVDSADLPLNVSREMIQESPILSAIKKGVTSRVLGDLEKLAEKEPDNYTKIWEHFGAVLKEGIYEDFERRDALLALARFKSTASGDGWRSQGLRRRAQGEPDRDLLPRRRRRRAARKLAPSRRLPGPRRRSPLPARSRGQFLGDVSALLRGQAVQVGDPGRG
jgi:HSP90 family molecular chaperone